MSDAYIWIKAVHVIAVIAWMAGVLYLPRLFVYHAQQGVGSPTSELFKVMERRLMYAITFPAAGVAWIMGLLLINEIGLKGNGWLHGKLVLVALLTGVTFMLEKFRRGFAADRNDRSSRFYRVANEVPTLLMIGIVILVVVKPGFE